MLICRLEIIFNMFRCFSQHNSEILPAQHVEVLVIFRGADVNNVRSQPGSNGHLGVFFAANVGNDAHAVLKLATEQTLPSYFLTVLARFSLSIKRRSEAEHLERTTPISDSFLRSMAASAAPSRSLVKDKKALPTG